MWKEVNILSTISEHMPSATLINVHVTNDLLLDKTSYHMCSGVEFVIIVFVYIYSLFWCNVVSNIGGKENHYRNKNYLLEKLFQ